jgi:hypothetical protein
VANVLKQETSKKQLLPERQPEVGELVQIRARRWLVEEVVSPEVQGQSSLVRLACADELPERCSISLMMP